MQRSISIFWIRLDTEWVQQWKQVNLTKKQVGHLRLHLTTFLSNDQPKLVVICSRNITPCVKGGQRNYRRGYYWNFHSLSWSIRDWNQQNAKINWHFFGNNSNIFFCCAIPLLISRKLWKNWSARQHFFRVSLSHDIDVDAWKYERTPRYAPELWYVWIEANVISVTSV